MIRSRREAFKWYRDVIRVLVHKELTVRYKNSYLGFLWSLLNPLANALILNLVFGVVLNFGTQNYLVVLLSCLFPWQWFSNSVGQSPHMFLANVTLVKQIAFPRLLIPLVTVLSDMVHFLISLPIYVVFMLVYGLHPEWTWAYGVPILLVISACTIYGLSLIFATINMFFRDLGNIVLIMLSLLFYATPIMYTVDKMPDNFRQFLVLNPIAPLFISWRDILIDNIININYIFISSCYSLVFIVVGILVYHIFNKRFAEVM